MNNNLMSELQDVISPRHITGKWDAAVSADITKIAHIEIKSADLSRFIGASTQIVILAATLGVGADIYLQKLMHTDMAKAVLADKLASGLIEEYVNEIQAELGVKGKRYSPGYGDFDIKHQKDILALLGCEKIGLYMTDGYMLTPSKSITAIYSQRKTSSINQTEFSVVSNIRWCPKAIFFSALSIGGIINAIL